MKLAIRPYEPEPLHVGSWGDLEFTLAEEPTVAVTARWLLVLSSLAELLAGLATLYTSPTQRSGRRDLRLFPHRLRPPRSGFRTSVCSALVGASGPAFPRPGSR